MKKKFVLFLGLLLCTVVDSFGQKDSTNEVTIQFKVECGANGELDAKEGTTVTIEVVDTTGKKTTISYIFPRGSHARAIAEYFDTALRARGIIAKDSMHDDKERTSKLKIKNVKSVKVGTSLNGKLPVTFIFPSPPPTPTPRRRSDTIPPVPTPKPPPKVITGKLPQIQTITPPLTPRTAKPHRGPTTFPRHGPGSIQILVIQSNSSGGQGGETTMQETLSISVTQGMKDVVITHKFDANTTATQITKYFHDELVKAGVKLKSYQDGDTQLFFMSVSKLDGAYSSKGARTTFGYSPDTPIIIDDKGEKKVFYNYHPGSAGANYIMCFPSLDALNDYFDWINATWSGDIAHLNTMQGFSAEGRYMINPNFGLGAGYRLLKGKTTGTTLNGANNYSVDIASQGGYLFALGQWFPRSGRLSLGGQFNLGYFGARYTEREELTEDSGSDAAPGYNLEASIGYQVSDHFKLKAAAGYQGLSFDNFGLSWYSPGKPPVLLNLSGFSLQVGLEYGFGK